MSNKLPNADILIPITAQNFDVEVLEVRNLFMFPDKKQQLLRMCSAAGVNPVDITADAVHFRRNNIKTVVAYMKQIGMKPILTQEADVSSVRQVSDAFNVLASYNGSINLTLTTPEGTTSLATNIEVQNIDDADAAKLLRIIKSAAAAFNKPMSINMHTESTEPSKALVPYVEPSQVEDFRKDLQASMEKIGYFKEYAITMDNLPKPTGTEVKQTYATAITITFPDGKTVKTPLIATAATILSQGDVLVGPHPKLLPLQAGIVKYTIVEVTPSTVSFTVAHKGKDLHTEAYKLTREQFEDLADLYHVKKQSATAFNVMKRNAMADERTNNQISTLTDKKSPTPTEKETLKVLKDIKNNKQAVAPTNVISPAPKVTPPATVTPPNVPAKKELPLPVHMQKKEASAATATPSVRLFSSLGLW